MVHVDAEYKKIEKIITYYEKLTTAYKVTCDECGQEIKDKETYFEMEFDTGDDYIRKDYCPACAQKKMTEWLTNPTEAVNIEPVVVDMDQHIGKIAHVDEAVYNLFERMKNDDN